MLHNIAHTMLKARPTAKTEDSQAQQAKSAPTRNKPSGKDIALAG